MFVSAVAAICVAAGLAADASGPAPTGDDAHVDAYEVHRFSFEEDADYDRQPDGWSRRRGPGFPQYVRSMIDRDTAAHGRQSLLVELNGAAFACYSPLQPVDGDHSYVLRACIRSAGLSGDAALVSISLLDSTRRRLARYLSRPVTGEHRRWATVEIGPFRPGPDTRFLVVGCHIAQGDTTDVRGQVWFDDLWLGSMPLLELTQKEGLHYLNPRDEIQIHARATGLAGGQAHRLRLRLEDGAGSMLEQAEFDLAPDEPAGADTEPRAPIAWILPPRPNGFYRVRAALEHAGAPVLARESTFVVMDPAPGAAAGEFGWSVSAGPGKLPLGELAEIAARSGVNWLKLPLWSAGFAEQDSDFSTSKMNLFLDKLDEQGIALVGMLSDPPAQLTEKYARHWVGISKIFTMPREFWSPSLELIIARHSFRIRHWQLGAENDDSFVGLSMLSTTVATVKRELDRIGHDARIGFHWKWDQPFPELASPEHSFLSLGDPAGQEDSELETNLERSLNSPLPRWALVAPPPGTGKSAEERASDLTRQMLAAKLGRAQAVFITDPLDPERGLLNADGSPTELYLPWRTVALALRGAKYVGRFELPQKSPNAVFDHGNEIVVVVWNPQPAREEFYFGEQPVAVDLWGRREKLATSQRPAHSAGEGGFSGGATQIVEVGPVPKIIRNCSTFVSRWRLAVKFEKGRISSEFGQHEDALLVSNTFPQGISGKAVVHFPPGWEVDPHQWTLQAAAGESFKLPLFLTFPLEADLGDLRPSIDFEVSADRPYKFSMFLPYRLGLGDVELAVVSRRTPDGRLEVEQKITNNTEPLEILEFNCRLVIPGQIRQQHFVTRLGHGEDQRIYVVPNADSLRGGQLWLRAEQVNGRRVLNYHWKVED